MEEVFVFEWVFIFEGVFVFEWVFVSSGSSYLRGSSFSKGSLVFGLRFRVFIFDTTIQKDMLKDFSGRDK